MRRQNEKDWNAAAKKISDPSRFRIMSFGDEIGLGAVNVNDPFYTKVGGAIRAAFYPHDTLAVSAVIYGADQLRLDAWQVVAGIGQVVGDVLLPQARTLAALLALAGIRVKDPAHCLPDYIVMVFIVAIVTQWVGFQLSVVADERFGGDEAEVELRVNLQARQ